MKNISAFIALFFTSLTVTSQDINWYTLLTSNYGNGISTILPDANNVIYIGGLVGRGEPKLGETPLPRIIGFTDVIISRLNSSGQVEWAKTKGDSIPWTSGQWPPTDSEWLNSMAFNSQGDKLIMCGNIDSKDTGDCPLNGNNLEQGSGFVMAMSKDGDCLWSKSIYGPNAVSTNTVIPDGENFFIAAQNSGSSSIIEEDNITLSGTGTHLLKISADGSTIVPLAYYANIYADIRVQGDLIYYAGTYTGTITVNGVTHNSQPGKSDGCFFASDKQGNVKWFRDMKSDVGVGLDRPSVDIVGNFYIAGAFGDRFWIGDDTVRLEGYHNFILKYSPEGNLVWKKILQDNWLLIETSKTGTGFYAYGNFSGTIELDGHMLSSVKNEDMFYAGYDSSGNCTWARQIPGVSFARHLCENGNELLLSGESGPYDTLVINGQEFTGKNHAFIVSVNKPTGIEEIAPSEPLMIYANPTSGECKVSIPQSLRNEKNITLKIYDLTGKLIEEQHLPQGLENADINFNQKAKGTYQVVIESQSKKVAGQVVFK